MTQLLVVVALLAFAGSCYAGFFFAALFFGGVLVWAEVRLQFSRAEARGDVFPQK